MAAVTAARMMNGGGDGHVAGVGDREIGASMMEQLVPEITTHALSYLDYPSLCRLSMTNSSMRRAANDDNAWKALYHKVVVVVVFLTYVSLVCCDLGVFSVYHMMLKP